MDAQVEQGRPRHMWIDDIKMSTSLDTYEVIKRIAQDRQTIKHGEPILHHIDPLHQRIAEDDDEIIIRIVVCFSHSLLSWSGYRPTNAILSN